MTQLAESLPTPTTQELTVEQQGMQLADRLMARYPHGTEVDGPILDRMLDLAGGDVKKAAGFIMANAVHWQE